MSGDGNKQRAKWNDVMADHKSPEAQSIASLHPEKEFHAFLAEGKFMIQRSRSSGRHIFFPRVCEPVTGATDLEWVPASGRGTVYSTTTILPRAPAEPYNVTLVDLEEGPRIMSRVDGIKAEDVRIGSAVEARIIEEEGKPLIIFVPRG
jgi:uncharacterized OB-fold protein